MVEWKSIGEISSNVFAGGTPSTKHEEYYDGDIPWIRSGEIDFNVITKAERNITTAGYENSSAKLIRKGSVVMAMTGATVAKSAIVDFETTANQSVCAIETVESIVNYKFVFYSLAKDYFKIRSSAQGALTSLNLTMIKQLQIPIPSLSEQQRIVSILDTFTSSISNLKQQIEERRKQYEYERDLLLDLEGKEGVEWKRLSEICEIKGEYGLSVPSKPFDGVRYIRITDITDDGKLNSDCVSADYNEITKVPLEEGDLLFARTGATVGKTLMYLKEYGKCLYAGYLIRYRVNREVVLPKYVFHFTHSNKYNLWVKSNLVEGAQPNINAQKYNSLEILIPSLQEQSRIVSILDTFEQSISNLEEQLAMREKQYEYYRKQLLTFEGEEERGKT